MNTEYTVRLSRIDKPEIGCVMPVTGGNYSACLSIIASSAEEACRYATEFMAKETGKNDWRIHNLILNDNRCSPWEI